MRTFVGTHVHMLDVEIENQNGQLISRVYHGDQTERYTLPFLFNPARSNHSHAFRSALLRAVRYCSSVLDFARERIYLELTYVSNGYTTTFVETHLQQFFVTFDAQKLRLDWNQDVYDRLRARLFHFLDQQMQNQEHEQQLETHKSLFRFAYPYDYGSAGTFKRHLRTALHEHVKGNSKLMKKDLKIYLTTKPAHSLNTLLAIERPHYRQIQC